jgi:ATP-dependent Clp protease ATP-binding subunit ClpX
MARFQKFSGDEAANEGFRCSFCGKEPRETSDLIAGDEVFICDECVAKCVEMLAREELADEGDDTDSAR